jgi:hypothetical protein
MNSGLPPDYGFWYPGAVNDGGCGGGFEALPYNTTWLGQLMHRGPWYYSCEENLGFCGYVRAAAAILADDPILGRICYGGSWQQTGSTNQVTPLDGVRRRFHAVLDTGQLHAELDTDRLAAAQQILLRDDLSLLQFALETDNPVSHTARFHFSVSIAGSYTVGDDLGTIATLNLQAGQEAVVDLPLGPNTTTKAFRITR